MEHLDNFAKILELDYFNNNRCVSLVAAKTHQKPERVSLVFLVLILSVLLFTHIGQLLLLYFIGFFYPTFKSY